MRVQQLAGGFYKFRANRRTGLWHLRRNRMGLQLWFAELLDGAFDPIPFGLVEQPIDGFVVGRIDHHVRIVV